MAGRRPTACFQVDQAAAHLDLDRLAGGLDGEARNPAAGGPALHRQHRPDEHGRQQDQGQPKGRQSQRASRRGRPQLSIGWHGEHDLAAYYDTA